MSENIFPAEPVQGTADVVEENYSAKSISELSDLFVALRAGEDAMTRYKEAEAIKSAFYRLIARMRIENEGSPVDPQAQEALENAEQNFKAMYADYKKDRAEYNRAQDEMREANLAAKKAIIEELKALTEGQDDVSSCFPAFRELQNRWKEAGPVPAQSYRDINDSYQFQVEKFYDMIKINRDLRDLDFRKNLEAKIALCEQAEALSQRDDVVEAFKELQKYHEQWKEYGPVSKEYREDIWNRFKAATAVVNKKYQAHFESLKGEYEQNLEKKRVICEKAEELLRQEIGSTAEWNEAGKQMDELLAEWKTIGYATKKENQKIYERFRAACDTFYARKREYYTAVKDTMNENVSRKISLIEQAEALKDSTDWKKTTDQFISLQKQWKEIGYVPRKKADQLWKRFRAACDAFFENRDENAPKENDIYSNLKAKKRLIDEILAYESVEDEAANADKMRAFADRWNEIGHVPYKEKDNIIEAYRAAMNKKFPLFSKQRQQRQDGGKRSPKDALIARYNALQQDITTYENNIGFFSASKSSAPLIKQMQEKIEQSKRQLKELEEKIRNFEEDEQ
ncbi:MAG: DUF349 domain-containing protein [Bacteroidales bacterium]|nr:DUF349 domain-containing protein [Bacteroidales bacterium]